MGDPPGRQELLATVEGQQPQLFVGERYEPGGGPAMNGGSVWERGPRRKGARRQASTEGDAGKQTQRPRFADPTTLRQFAGTDGP